MTADGHVALLFLDHGPVIALCSFLVLCVCGFPRLYVCVDYLSSPTYSTVIYPTVFPSDLVTTQSSSQDIVL